eukprot:1719676-Rhodomonas_salina.1
MKRGRLAADRGLCMPRSEDEAAKKDKDEAKEAEEDKDGRRGRGKEGKREGRRVWISRRRHGFTRHNFLEPPAAVVQSSCHPTTSRQPSCAALLRIPDARQRALTQEAL